MKKVREFSKQDGWYEINPESAAKLLASGEKNRPLNEVRAGEIASAIKAGRWSENGESIVLCSGRLIDGQHRLRAVTLSGKPIVSAVIHLDREKSTVFDTIDTGRVRTGADRLAIDGVPNGALTAAIVRLVISQERGIILSYSGGPCLYEIRSRYQKSPETFDRASSLCVSIKKDVGRLAPLSMLGAVYAIGSKKNPDLAKQFLVDLSTGENCKSGNSALAFRNRVTDFITSGRKPHRTEIFALLLKAWIAYRDGRALRVLKFDKREEYPNIVEG